MSQFGEAAVVDDKFPRLKVMSGARIENCREAVGAPDPAPWPEIEGCLTALCTARSGSTLLSRQFETAFELGEMGEKLNPKNFRKQTAQAIVAAREESWFGYKCSTTGLICAELSGFADAYLHKTVFVRLLRRDIIAQAVSRARASQTGQWHVHNPPTQEPVYDAERIAASVKTLAIGVEQLRAYADRSGRPHAVLNYEDIATGGVAAVKAVGSFLGLPERKSTTGGELFRPIEKMGDAVNDEWKERFLKEMKASIGRIVEDYITSLELGTPARWATSAHGPDPTILKKEKRNDKDLVPILARFPHQGAVLGRAAVETLRTRFPTGTCLVVEKGEKNKLLIRFGTERSLQNAIFTIAIYALGEVKIFFNGGEPLVDPDQILKGQPGKRYFPVTDVFDLEKASLFALFDQAVQRTGAPLPENGGGLVIVKSSITKTKVA